MPRKATGTIVWERDHWKARIRLSDGSRPWIDLPKELSEAQARKKALELTVRARSVGAVKATAKSVSTLAAASETLGDWSERWINVRETKGYTSVRDDQGRLRKYILPVFRAHPVRAIVRAEIEAFVETLDKKVRADELSWKTAVNVWALLRRMFGDASGAKDRTLRVREDNPCQGVHGPDRGSDKAKTYLYPSEFLALVECERVPLRWARLFSLATYLHLRIGEIAALRWEDIDLEHGTVNVHKSIEANCRIRKSTKTGGTRRFSLEREIVPMLVAMKAESPGTGPVIEVPCRNGPDGVAVRLRQYLRFAGAKREDLFVHGDDERKNITFHDLRATGITWMAIRGDEALKIKHRAGHASLSTTEGYIREAENVREGFGVVFPPLPQRLVEWSGNGPKLEPSLSQPIETIIKNGTSPEGFEPSLPA